MPRFAKSIVTIALASCWNLAWTAGLRGADCNLNGMPDGADIALGSSDDCNENGVPDECDIEHHRFEFELPNTYAGCSSVSSLDLADLDGDGDLDAAAVEFQSNEILTFSNRGNGVLAPPRRYAAGFRPVSGVAANFDGDALPDLAVLSGVTGSVSVLRNRGNGAFAPAVAHATSLFPSGLLAADLDGDGSAELVTWSGSEHRLAILWNRGDAAFEEPVVLLVEREPLNTIAADLDGDGDKDLALVSEKWSRLSVLLNAGSRTFVAGLRVELVDPGRILTPVDLDSDGDLDIVVHRVRSLHLLWNSGDATFDYGPKLADGDVEVVEAADLDGDGDSDLVVGGGYGLSSLGESASLENLGGASFGVRPFVLPLHATELKIGDLDGDGLPDLAMVERCRGGISVWLNRARRTSTDCNGDGVPDDCQRAKADCNRNGVLDACEIARGEAADADGDLVPDSCELSPGQRFEAAQDLGHAYDHYALAVGDFDGDRLPDLIGSVDRSPYLRLFLNEGSGELRPARSFLLPSRVSVVAALRLDGAGSSDLAFITGDGPVVTGDSELHVWRNDGCGGFPDCSRLSLPAPWPSFATQFLEAADLNGDHRADLVAVAASRVFVFRSLGEGSFVLEPQPELGTRRTVSCAILADFDGDGHQDLATAADRPAEILVFRNCGAGAFSTPETAAEGGDPAFLAAADLDADGDADLAIAGRFSRDGPLAVRICLSNGDGTFAPPRQLDAGQTPFSLAAGDFDGDGDPDLVVSDLGEIQADSGLCSSLDLPLLRVFLNRGDGRLLPGQSVPANVWCSRLAAVDWDGDRVMDLLRLGHPSIFLNRSDGSFIAAPVLAVEGTPVSLAAADFDGDGSDDLATANRFSDDVSVLLQIRNGAAPRGAKYPVGRTPLGIAAADFDGDGAPDLATADANDDGHLNVTDAVALLGALSLSGRGLPEPFRACGPDTTPDSLNCTRHNPCD